ncbi:hypothetical protein AB0B50_43160, partial [Streptomyces sp. NPDC041068]|uniref:hypothetical protein n=1 Tax=Streptomyces sp. NPDC041068 TaxID=3155130 RepID=UPI0033EF39E4
MVEGRSRRGPRPLAAFGVGCYALVAIAGMFLLGDGFGLLVQIPLWIAHCVLLAVLIHKLGAKESSVYAALFIVAVSVMSVGVAGMARDDITLQRRGEEITATVVEERRDEPRGREARAYHYTLERRDGTRVPGPEMKPESGRYAIGQEITVIADPEGELAPRTPGEADATGELLGAGAFALAALGSVAWMARRGSIAVRETAVGVVAGEQEKRLREALRTYPTDRRGYIEVPPEEYPDVSHGRAARIAWEMGLRAEGAGNRGGGGGVGG